jgi:hypothetical protein
MQRVRDGQKKRTLALAFPEDDADDRAPSDIEPGEQSRIARRRLSSAPAHEVDDGEVELIEPDDRLPASATIAIARHDASAVPASVAPFAIDAAAHARRPRALRTVAIALSWVAAIGLVLGVAFLYRQAQRRIDPKAVALAGHSPADDAETSRPTAPRAASTRSPANDDIPVVDVGSLPRARVGTVIGAIDHRLWIDGNLAAGSEALVRCGTHTVQVGSAGALRTVDVPCGDAIHVEP